MPQDQVISLKEFIQMNVSELKQSIKDVHETAQKGLEQSLKTNGRVNTLDEAVEKITTIIERHDSLLVMDDAKTKQRDDLWKKVMWATPLIIAGLGYFGWLYVEHIKTEVVAETSKQVLTLIDQTYKPIIK